MNGNEPQPDACALPKPLLGDGLHVFHEQGGVLAYLRWIEVQDSRHADV
eukprot:CAMPEP_0180654872 /NCGR_PEP_ID=MMETSP1037_2-20121125/54956_1 /TAXON_ID=632150 /ORGANISM="Azadinium spinosum, Strain 3D9" /LENGTH=48 /DNA_ID= /DNA_START= /DNA_END= /DNA_ORIENTATION=